MVLPALAVVDHRIVDRTVVDHIVGCIVVARR